MIRSKLYVRVSPVLTNNSIYTRRDLAARLRTDLATDPTLATAFRDQIVAARLAGVRRLLEKGIHRGEIKADVEFELVHDMLFGPVYYRLLLSGAPLDAKLAERIIEALMPGLSTAPNGHAPVPSPALTAT